MNSPPSAPRPVGVGSGRNPCPASARPSPGEGFPGVGWSPKVANARRGRTRTLKPSRGARGLLTDTVPPTLPGSDTQDFSELSLKPPAGSKGDPGETRSSSGQEVLQSLEAIKAQTPSRQGGVTQGAGRPSPAARTAGLAFRAEPFGALARFSAVDSSSLLTAREVLPGFFPFDLGRPLSALLRFSSQPSRHSSPPFQVSRLYNWSSRVAPGRTLGDLGPAEVPARALPLVR